MISKIQNLFTFERLPAVFFVLYLSLTLFTSGQFNDQSSTTESIRRYLYVTCIALGFFAIWRLLATVSSLATKYSEIIKGSDEQPAFRSLALGTQGLFISLVFTAFLNIFRVPSVGTQAYELLTITLYYASGLIAVYYFYHVGRAGHILANYVKRETSYQMVISILLAILGFGGLIIWQIISNKTTATLGVNHILNYINSDIILYTLLLPLIVGWVYGLAGAYGFYMFLRYGKGVIYRSAFAYLCIGVVMLVTVSVTRQVSDYLSGSASQLTLLDDFPRIMALLGLAAASMVCMRRGMLRLFRIENITK